MGPKKGERINLKAASAKRVFDLEISEAEQAANLAAPARQKNERAARVDHRVLDSKDL